MTPVGFEPTQLALVELESTPLDHSGKVSLLMIYDSSAMRSMAHKTIALTTELTPCGFDSRSPLSRSSLGFVGFHGFPGFLCVRGEGWGGRLRRRPAKPIGSPLSLIHI